ncbi:lysine transporter LysE [Streptomyces viridochromogenes]|uniref:Lysine transporter LysE n=1 Tax=Streptomyces viridochromogenes TaxID=1938 RepID=A0A0J7Z1U2_STRVR|nr:LysE family translocator [Streptomyces viridochromogenes]KMS69587.1 lysine transporter LysE [Streptomyces viridochromogenes]KOG14242.1 lysine transporter LysE [Streptomyces viridochromogenes]KOG15559.1 lysine transporter LysE [Streptomyces viridochromogenes]
MMTSVVAFVGAALLIAVVPGPSTVVILRRAVVNGRRTGMATVMGNECGVLLWGLAAAFGLSALLLASQVAYDVIRIAGAAVLVWMGARALWQARRASQPDQAPAEIAAVSLRRAYWQGLVTNFANPKAGVFAVSFLPQFVPHGAPVLPTLLAFSVTWAVVDLIWYLPLVWLAGRVGGVLQRQSVRRRMEQVSGALLGFISAPKPARTVTGANAGNGTGQFH